MGLSKLVSYGLLSDPTAIRDWGNGIADIDEDRLIEGFRAAKDYSGYMTLGDFRELCKKPRSHASHQPYKALEVQPLTPDESKPHRDKLKLMMGIKT
jgi:hypothetical protein